MTTAPGPLDRRAFDTQQLMDTHPPVWDDPNKRVVFAIACPPGSVHQGRLEYTRWPAMPLPDALSVAGIAHILGTAYSAFRAAGLEADRERGSGCATVVHTGFWGCGAFGGNRELMAMLQVLAARMAGVRRLVFHTFDAAGTNALAAALRAVERDLASAPALTAEDIIQTVAGRGLEWGESDGN